MQRGLRIIINKYRKRHQRGKGIKLYGIKSIECNFNPQKRTYNPHIHLILPNKEIADIITNEWLTICTPLFASPLAQKSKSIENTEIALIEVVKYGSKIFTEQDVKNKSKQKSTPFIYVAALDNILRAMKDHRIFDRFGFDLPKSNKPKTGKSTPINEYEEWQFDLINNDWINSETEQALSGYALPLELRLLLSDNIDKELE